MTGQCMNKQMSQSAGMIWRSKEWNSRPKYIFSIGSLTCSPKAYKGAMSEKLRTVILRLHGSGGSRWDAGSAHQMPYVPLRHWIAYGTEAELECHVQAQSTPEVIGLWAGSRGISFPHLSSPRRVEAWSLGVQISGVFWRTSAGRVALNVLCIFLNNSVLSVSFYIFLFSYNRCHCLW